MTAWDLATQRLAARFRQWVGQTVTVQWPRRKAVKAAGEMSPSRHTVTGVIGQVTATGFTVEWQVPDGWETTRYVVQRAFVTWADLWATLDRVQVTGRVVDRVGSVHVEQVISQWIADTAQGMGMEVHPGTAVAPEGA